MVLKLKVIGVISGKGGVGKTTVAASIALNLSKKYKVGLLDIDVTAPNVPGLLGIKEMPKIDKYLHPVNVNENLKMFSIGLILPREDHAVVWFGNQKIGAVEQSVYAVKWGKIDYLVVDTPPGTSDEIITAFEMFPMMHAVIVSTPQYLSLLDASRAIQMCKSRNIDILGLVENMKGVICPKCGEFIPLGEDRSVETLAERNGVEYLGGIPLMPKKGVYDIAQYTEEITERILRRLGVRK